MRVSLMGPRAAVFAAALTLYCLPVHSANAQQLPLDGIDEASSSAKARRLTLDGLRFGILGDKEARDAAFQSALKIAPHEPLAHWHSGETDVAGRWTPVQAVEDAMALDEPWAEYRALRDASVGNASQELLLAKWCRQHGLADAEALHLRRVLSNPSTSVADRQRAMKLAGVRPFRGALLTEQEIQSLQSRLDEERARQAKWWPRAEKWQAALLSRSRRKQDFAAEQLSAVSDPAAIPALETLFSSHSPRLASRVVDWLSQSPAYEATESLVRHSVGAAWQTVRDAATDKLRERPLHEVAPLLLGRLEAPVESKFYVGVGPDGMVRHQHQFLKPGPEANHLLTHGFLGGPQFVNTKTVRIGGLRRGDPDATKEFARVERERLERLREADFVRRFVMRREAARALQLEHAVARSNMATERNNVTTFAVLERVTGQKLARSPAPWWQWWQEYNEVYSEETPTYTHQFGRADPYYIPWTRITLHSCFPAGTQVRGQTGPVAIEQIKVGDRVLSQDVETGRLAHKLVVRTTKRPPSELLRITLGDTTILTTSGHPFWVPCVGWRMAKRLEPGQQLYCLGGSHRIDRVEPAERAPAYNLVVADFNNYFLAESDLLVHDNTYRKPSTALIPGLLAEHLVDH